VQGSPVEYFDFEFEQYFMNKDILYELLLDEIILANSKEAREFNKVMRKTHKNGILELLYEK
jgi:hypothetical protein